MKFMNYKIWALIISLAILLISQRAVAIDDTDRLRHQYKSLLPQLENNQFHRQLYLDSTESKSNLKGDIYAVVDHPFTTVNRALNDSKHGPEKWCEILILHLNTKYCNANISDKEASIKMGIGKKIDAGSSNIYDLKFNYRVVASVPKYFQIELNADKGPLSTKDYRIVLEAVAINNKSTFLHMTYSYSYGVAGRVAMSTYLATAGREKVGFTPIAKDTIQEREPSSSKPNKFIGGMRGVVERNSMRYYLAIDAYLSNLSGSPEERLERRLTNWFEATEQYPRQLHEVKREEYMTMKHNQTKAKPDKTKRSLI